MPKVQRKIVGGTSGSRQCDDFYPTPAYVTRALLENHKFEGDIWECACGDRIPRPIDFLLENTHVDNIVTNPPFNLSYEFILQGLRLADKCLALFLPIRYLTGKSRAEIYKQNPPTKIIVIPNKVDFLGNGSPVMEFAWFIWEKGKQRSEIVWAEWSGRGI